MEMLLTLLLVTVCGCDETTLNSPIQYVWSPYTGFALLPQHAAFASTGNTQYYGNTAGQEYRFDTGYHSVNNINLHNLHAQLGLETDPESEILPIDKTVEGICENESRKILAVWRVVAEVLGLNHENKIGNLEEVKRLSLIIKSFLTLSKEKDFNRMSIRQILATIQEHLNDDDLSREIMAIIQKPEVDSYLKDSEKTEAQKNVHFNKNFDIHESEIKFIKNIGIEENAALIENLEMIKKQNYDIVNGPPDLVKTIILQASSSPGALIIGSNLEVDKDSSSRIIGTNVQMEKMLADVSNSNIRAFEDEKIPYIMASESGTDVLTGEIPINEVSKVSSLLASTEPNFKAVLIDVSPNNPPIHSSDFTSESVVGSLIKEAGESIFSPSKSNFKALLIEVSSNNPSILDSEHVSGSHVESLLDPMKNPNIRPFIETDVDKPVAIGNAVSSSVVSESPLFVERTKIPVVTPLEYISDEIKSLSFKENAAGMSSIFGVKHTSVPHVKAVIIGESSNSLASGQISESNRYVINEATNHLISAPIVSVIDSKSIDDISEPHFQTILIEPSAHVASLHIPDSHMEPLSLNEAVNLAIGNSGTNEISLAEFDNEPSFKSQLEALAHETIKTSIHTPSASHIIADIIEVPANSANRPFSDHISDFDSMLIKENEKLSAMSGSVHFPESDIKTIVIAQSTGGHGSDISKSHAESSLIKQVNASSNSEDFLTENISVDSHFVPIAPHLNDHYSGKIVQSYDAVQQINAVSIWQEIVTRYGGCTSSRSNALLIEVKALLDALEMEECTNVHSQNTIKI